MEETERSNFIKSIIEEDRSTGKHDEIVTRFPPEPNGYLHIGHAKSICLNFGLPLEYPGKCHLRFDDSNPAKEDVEYVNSIQDDIRWLGFDWGGNLHHASNYFSTMYDFAVQLIKKDKAYVCSLSQEEIREYRGTLTEPGKASPYRDRSVEENLELFKKMKNGEFPDGAHVLRAKIDMASGNLNMRDPALYRIKHDAHHRTGTEWCVYPMYDYCHCISDSLEGITHSLCTLEFEDHRPLYDWILDEIEVDCHPRQIEFARLNMSYTLTSKRKLLTLVTEGHVTGWDDPRMPTIAGLRRRGMPPEAIRDFCERIGVAKANSIIDLELFNFCVRESLKTAPRIMGVLDPVRVIIDNYPEEQIEDIEADNNPEDPEAGKRMVPFSKEIFIERSDFMEDPPRKYFRLSPGKEVRLKHAYYITCTEVVRDGDGEVKEIHCTYDPESRGGGSPDGRKVKGTLHWVSAKHAVKAEVRIYDNLFLKENPDDVEEGQDFTSGLNPDSLKVVEAMVEPSIEGAEVGSRYQFLRQGYYCIDSDSKPESIVFNQIVGLRDSWAKSQKK